MHPTLPPSFAFHFSWLLHLYPNWGVVCLLCAAKDDEIKKAKAALDSLEIKLKTTREQNEATLLESEAGAEEMQALVEQVDQGALIVKKCQEEAAALESVVVEKRELFAGVLWPLCPRVYFCLLTQSMTHV